MIMLERSEALVDALGVDDDEVIPEATLQGDLDAESIDFLDSSCIYKTAGLDARMIAHQRSTAELLTRDIDIACSGLASAKLYRSSTNRPLTDIRPSTFPSKRK